jgi:hypothetical protein
MVFIDLLAGFLTFLTRASQAAVVFSNYTGNNCNCGNGGGPFTIVYAAGFVPDGFFDFTGAAAFVQNRNYPKGNPQAFVMALYASTPDGEPAASPLWVSQPLIAPGPNGAASLITANYSGPLIFLRATTEYFFVLDFPEGSYVGWLPKGPTLTPLYSSRDGVTWKSLSAAATQQFEIFGGVGAPVPEPATWAMMLIGFAGLGYAAARRKSCGFHLINRTH